MKPYPFSLLNHLTLPLTLTPGYKTLVEGQYVQFDLVRTDKGLQAKNVVEIDNVLV